MTEPFLEDTEMKLWTSSTDFMRQIQLYWLLGFFRNVAGFPFKEFTLFTTAISIFIFVHCLRSPQSLKQLRQKETLSQILQEKDQLQREQEDRIKNFTKLLVTSSDFVSIKKVNFLSLTDMYWMLNSLTVVLLGYFYFVLPCLYICKDAKMEGYVQWKTAITSLPPCWRV